jgi:hypothetical protein
VPLAPMITAHVDNVIALVWIMKSMREMGCGPCMRDQDAKVVSRWIKKIKKTLIQIKVPNELRADYTTQLRTDRA